MYQMIARWHHLCWLLTNFPAGLYLFCFQCFEYWESSSYCEWETACQDE